ncbi:hypothetical protein GLAREA_09327 [Glarea lozoyensis ATCC 20868]|uniref:Extracellular serine-rich protein n=1 Tax=Glarea lozoyensis (strain ATCC 20868 / MF5171) TaxID=1116229 RepID=S3DJ39_GLAL2|nr:uncharacterized protein GLAREA_09327 [Glarea lozoyensis ATCC 20868]EPE37164.1 hypothetical protein GLAREA_09327 [Glarea lozoyensis ATCC 20868]
MLFNSYLPCFEALTIALLLPCLVTGHQHSWDEKIHIGNQTLHRPSIPISPTRIILDGTSILTNTTGAFQGEGKNRKRASQAGSPSGTRSTFLVLARDASSAYSAYSGLNDYGIPYELKIIPAGGTTLPTLQTSDANPMGNYGGIVVLSEVSYADANGNWASAITAAQWTTLYNYQTTFGVRMVRLDVSPSAATGTRVVGSCCSDGQEQPLYISDITQFPTAGLKQGATLSSLGLYHYPAAIIDTSTTRSIANFMPTTGFTDYTTAAVINNFSGRQQMVFFMPFATDWALTSTVLTHAWIHWATRGLYAGFRRAMLHTQVDDMFLKTTTWDGDDFRISTADLATHIQWQASIGSKLPAGSNYTIELGHNGNGNIENAFKVKQATCPQGSVQRVDPPQTDLEYIKPIGSGTNFWPLNATSYTYTDDCIAQDPVAKFFLTPATRDSFMHVSHTFTHENENAATYSDVTSEITWNQKWLAQIAIAKGKWFSPNGIIPPAITGLHNGDALRAWKENGILNVVGDNTRPVLLNTINEHWPLITSVAKNGFDGIMIIPRWATNIYYNCDDTACDIGQWKSLGNSGTLSTLLDAERSTNTRHLLRLKHDPFMFHQANMRWEGVDRTTVNGVTNQYSLLQIWVENIVAEVTRLTTWPLISLKHDDIAASFRQRMTRDQCNYTMTNTFSGSTITGFSVSAPSVSNRCAAPIPITLPGPLAENGIRYNTEQLGSDPLTVWVDLNGRVMDFRLKDPISW